MYLISHKGRWNYSSQLLEILTSICLSSLDPVVFFVLNHSMCIYVCIILHFQQKYTVLYYTEVSRFSKPISMPFAVLFPILFYRVLWCVALAFCGSNSAPFLTIPFLFTLVHCLSCLDLLACCNARSIFLWQLSLFQPIHFSSQYILNTLFLHSSGSL